MQLKKILLAVDGSEHALRAARYAADLARLMNGTILLLHVQRPLPIPDGEPYFRMASASMRDGTNRLLDPFISLLREKGAPFVDRVEEGAAGQVIPKVAAMENSDVIVMGSRGLSDLEGLFIGSVTHRVLRSAPCPVLVVR